MRSDHARLHKRLIVVALMVTISSFFVSPKIARAQFADTIGGPIIARNAIKFEFSQAILAAATQGLVQATSMFLRQFAYDLAVGLASGAKGQNPLAFLSEPGAYFNSLAQDATGELIGTLSQGTWDQLGLDLCKPQIPQVALKIQLGLAQGVGAVDRPKPKCQWQQIANNWNSIVNQVRDPNYLLQNVALQFKPGQSDIGAAISLEGALANKLQANQQAGLAKRLEGNGILPKEGLISGNIETPAAVTKKKFEDLVDDSDNEFLGDNYDILNATVGGETWLALGKTVMSTFTNTLSQKLLQNVVGGLFQLARGSGGGTNINLNNLYALNPQGLDGLQAAQQAYSSLLVSNIKTGTGVDLVTEFSTCPQKREEGGIYNCVVDAQFAAALQQANAGTPLTVREAVAKRYLDANKPFGFSDPRASKEPDVTEGYSYSNMKKLRLARVIPVGWEFAAMKTKDDGIGRKNLGEVIDGFSKVGSVAGCGQPRSEDPTESPFCGLVDPDWVLKVPPAQCAQSAPGKLIDSSGSRMDSCIDLQNCVAEDERGNCKAWGYCTKEKRSWSVGGETCPAEYATCQGFQNTRTNQQVSYLRNTLDSTTCNSENAGCRWYSTARNIDDTNWKADSRIYLNGKAQSCNATAAGCTEFISSAANLLQNPGFEKNTASGNTVTAVDGWKPGLFTGYMIGAGNAYEGNAAMRGDSGFSQLVTLESASEYTLSIYGKGAGAVVVRVTGDVEQTRTTCTSNGSILSLVFRPSTAANATSFARGTCTFYATNAAKPIITIALKDGDATTVVDAIQLEKGAIASSFRAGYGASQSAFLKAPPTWLGCTGEEGESAECRNYARVCRREEVGCEQYTPVTADAALTGTITAADRCPQECVGYAAYKQEPSAFEAPLYPQYIIPSRANACPGEDIGCSAFTNLQSEKVEYYREVRACELPPVAPAVDDSGSYVTWEGSENSGYQIKNWVLKKSGVSIAGENNSPANKGVCGANNRCSNASTVTCRTNDDCIVNAFGQGQSGTPAVPPCTNYELVETGGSLHMVCRDTPTNQAVCVAGSVGVDPDCRGFYDAAGNIFYRQYSRTVLVTNSCSFARIGGTGTQLDEGACITRGGTWNAIARNCAVSVNGQTLPPTNLADVISCAHGRGTWRADRQECVYAIFAPESRSCQAASLGCREYSGNAGNNVRTIFTENFDAGIGSWQPGSPKMVQSSEAVNPGGYAARVEASVGSPTRITRSDIALDQNATYVVEFWAKGTGTVVPQIASGSTTLAMSSRGGALTTNWQRFSFGPTTVSFASSATATLAFELSGSNARMYIDTISLKKVAESLPLIQASTKNIPISCDSTPAALGGARAPQYMLGCAEYKDRANASHYIKSFSRFCRASSVGCAELSNTQNSSEQFGSTWNTTNAGVCRGLPNTDCYYNAATDTYKNTATAGDGFTLLCRIGTDQTSCTYGQTATGAPNLTADDVVVPAHSRSYLVVNAAGSCKQEEKGCQALGQQILGGWNTVYYKNLPDTYGETMCRHEENGCDAWTGGSGAVYFKAPTTTNECVWKDNVQIAGAQYNGWFKPNTVVVASIASAAECARAQGQWNQAASQCVKGDMPCYGEIAWNGTTWNINVDPEKTFLIGGKTFGVWKNIDSLYRGNIASCPQAQIGCTELVDRNDCRDAERKNCTAYYVKDNDKLDKKTCREKNSVSTKDGCVLFDDTSDPDKLYNTASSYQSGHLTAAVSAQEKNNANVLLSVRLDRSCAEWLTCQSAASVFDSSLGRFKLVCNTLGRCNEIVSRPDQGEVGQCANWVDQDTGDTSPAGIARAKNVNARLTRDIYQTRDITSFTAMDFSGYSIPNFYPIDRLAQVSWKNPVVSNAPDFRLAVVVPCDPRDTTRYKNCAGFDASTGAKEKAWPLLGRCLDARPATSDCGPIDAAGKGTGVCYENKSNAAIKTCIQNPDGAPATVSTPVSIACRAYPDRGAPFPSNPTIKSAQAFANATFCDDATGVGCECDYRKASYGGLKDFYFAKGATLEPKVCIGGTADTIPGISENTGIKKEGQSCIAHSECISGDCRALNKVTDYKGARGYCLEEDLSRSVYGDEHQHPCLTWLPSDSAVGSSDIYNQYTAAGFVPNPGNEWYCSEATTPEQRTITIDASNAATWFGSPKITGNACVYGDPLCNGGGYGLNCSVLFPGVGGWCVLPNADPAVTGSRPLQQLAGTVPGIDNTRRTNFLGCYAISSGGRIEDHGLENDWKGADPIYRNMIETISYDFGAANAETEACRSWTGKTSWSGGAAVYACSMEGSSGSSLGCKDKDRFMIEIIDRQSMIRVRPVFDQSSGRLTGFRVEAKEEGHTGTGEADATTFLIQGIKIKLKPGCQEIQRVSEKGAYTDRLWNKGSTDGSEANQWYRFDGQRGKDNLYNPEVRYKPWGAVGPNPVRSSYVVDAANDITANPIVPDYCKSPGSMWCGAAYGIDQLKRLFAKTSERAQWSPIVSAPGEFGVKSTKCKITKDQDVTSFTGDNNLCYVRAVSDQNSAYDKTNDTAEGQAKAPIIRPLGTCRDDGKCTEGATPGVTIGDKSGAQDLVLGYGGLLQTTMRFYAWADKDHMPLKRIVVDWHGAKDGGIPEYDAGNQNYYRNRRGLDAGGKEQCVDEKTAGEYANRDKYGFGSIINKSCDNAYFKFQITYTCPGVSSPFWEPAESCPLSEFASRYNGCCVFQPRAKVVDNWDWCSGNGGQTTGSCTETKGWVNFAGKVLVAPKYRQN